MEVGTHGSGSTNESGNTNGCGSEVCIGTPLAVVNRYMYPWTCAHSLSFHLQLLVKILSNFRLVAEGLVQLSQEIKQGTTVAHSHITRNTQQVNPNVNTLLTAPGDTELLLNWLFISTYVSILIKCWQHCGCSCGGTAGTHQLLVLSLRLPEALLLTVKGLLQHV